MQRHLLLRWLPAFLWGLIILVLSLMPGGVGAMTLFGIPHFDKIGHFGMYAGWTFFIMWGLGGHAGLAWDRKIFLTMFIGVCIGVLLEFGQKWMRQGRSFEGWDMVANAAGAVAGVGVFYLLFRWRRRR